MDAYDYDVVVIGAGVCGAVTAWRLALSGARVLILEAGPADSDRAKLVASYAGAIAKTPGSPYRDASNDTYAPTQDNFNRAPGEKYYVQPAERDKEGRVPFQSTYVRRAGGSTWHFLGNVPRFLPADFELSTRYHVGCDWPLTYADLEGDYCTAEEWIGVSGDHDQWNVEAYGRRSRPFPMSRIWPSYGDQVVARRLADKGGCHYDGTKIVLMSTPQARNARPYDGRPACAGNSSCVPICPIQAKYDATVHVAKALAAGAELRDKSVVTRLEIGGTGNSITSVHYRTWDRQEKRVCGRAVVLAAHAIESAKILLMSNAANRSDQVGRNLMDHLQGAVYCYGPEPVYPFRGPPTTSGIDVFRDGPFRSHRAAFRLSLGNDGWGRTARPEDRLAALIDKQQLFGKRLRDEVAATFSRMMRFSFSTEMLPAAENRVILPSGGQIDDLGIPRPELVFHVPPYNRAAFDEARRVCRYIFSHIGGTEVGEAPSGDDFSGAGHIMGTCRMGHSPRCSVVNSQGRSHDHPNLFIVGPAVFPTSGTANPTLTALALTIRAIPVIKRFLEES